MEKYSERGIKDDSRAGVKPVKGGMADAKAGCVSIIADHREKSTKVCEWLRVYDAVITEKQLDVADYIVSDRVGIERKTVEDFLQSVIDRRLFEQAERLVKSFESPLLILEGDQRMLFLSRNMHPNAIYGALASLAVNYRIPVIWTTDAKSTAAQIYWIAKREQMAVKRPVQVRSCKKTSTLGNRQEYMVAGLPNINSTISRRLLERFGTVRRVFSASEQRLMKVDGIGKKKAREIRHLLDAEYEKTKA